MRGLRRWALVGTVLLFVAGTVAFAGTAGTLDSSFGAGGVAVDSAFDNQWPSSVAIQSTGKIVVGGRTKAARWLFRRYNTDGSLDMAFGGGTGLVLLFGDGVKTASASFRHLCLDGDKIVATGDAQVITNAKRGTTETQLTTVRLLADGTPDPMFGTNNNGVVHISGLKGNGRAVAMQDGRVVVAGTCYAIKPATKPTAYSWAHCVVRYLANGNLDSGFGSGGIVTNDLTTDDDVVFQGAMGIQSNGTIVVGGTAGFTSGVGYSGVGYSAPWVVTRYSSAGTVLGIATSSGDYLRGLTVDGLDRIVAAGQRTEAGGTVEVLLTRYLASGAIDPDFGTGGSLIGSNVENARASGVRVAPGGNIVIGVWYGNATYLADTSATVARALDNGQWDPTFGTGGFGDRIGISGNQFNPYDRPALDVSANPVLVGVANSSSSGTTNVRLFIGRFGG